MMQVGIEMINAYTGVTCIDIRELFNYRGLDDRRFDNLMLQRKSVCLPCEDPVTYGVNAAKAIIDKLSSEERNSIELLITASESGLDFGKSLSTYIHDYLGLSKNCRLFEVKQACYAGTASLHMAACYIASTASPGAKALVVSTDVPRAAAKKTYGEPSQGVVAVAMLVSDKPKVLEIDWGASGMHSYEVMDTCRPTPNIEIGDSDLSLMSYLDCLEGSYRSYANRVESCDLANTFSYLVFHTPFGGMVKGAHRSLMKKIAKMSIPEIEADFSRRMEPSLAYGVLVGNGYSASVYLALCSLIDNIEIPQSMRVGIFSYGSGCSSEFYSGVIMDSAKVLVGSMGIRKRLDDRIVLDMNEYDHILDECSEWMFGIKDKQVDFSKIQAIYDQTLRGKNLLTLKNVENFHRTYFWS